jgi:hypothetical protein
VLLLVSTSFIVLVVCVVVLSPVVFALSVASHVKVEATEADNEMFTVPPLQIVIEFELVIVGHCATALIDNASVAKSKSFFILFRVLLLP